MAVRSAFAPAQAALRFETVAGRTAVVRAEARSPLRLLYPRHAGRGAWVCASGLGGGLVDGDAVRFDLSLGPGAQAALTTQASTKVYRGRASQDLLARVEEEGTLIVAPDPVVCFAGASYRQRQVFELGPRANLCVIDHFTSGRAAHGERWLFSSFESRLRLSREGSPELIDATLLSPEEGPVSERFGRFELIGLAALSGPLFSAGARLLLEAVSAAPLARRASLVWSAAPFGSDGLLLRWAAESLEQAQRELRSRLAFVWEVLGEDPWSRR